MADESFEQQQQRPEQQQQSPPEDLYLSMCRAIGMMMSSFKDDQ